MKRRLSLPSLLAVFVVIASCSSVSTPRALPPAVDSSRDSIQKAVLRGDANSTAAYFTAGAVITPPDAEEVVGRDSIRSLFSGVFQRVKIAQYEIKPDTIIRAGDGLAVERGTYVENVVPTQGPSTLLNGRYVFFWERGADGVWRASRLIYNHGPTKKPA
jgi:ketosteroid isomerase-like protein